ncbi:Kinesin-like protein KIF13B [Dissostichus eleginoides]|uniref:Kinesin-like protein KIF13B n=1 Tax=Dissostichus eleginoides TaxID=100907 RepID=A0AAD9B990_DISEL|nr:Kinesin-like protein KIF13B [Dissostichus eleginoides]
MTLCCQSLHSWRASQGYQGGTGHFGSCVSCTVLHREAGPGCGTPDPPRGSPSAPGLTGLITPPSARAEPKCLAAAAAGPQSRSCMELNSFTEASIYTDN